ncbi:C40 family peptidase [Blautia massiliensis (ex Durand et al. 2017)]|uniref:C40 family peptidase n=1 Tax=Blautia massiliensis (ex Durand et al. 2017) TaxID=1737424 RepID=UPI00241CBC6A|nr:C40 family peptidase [Blautia massiliensis (ex Durand et al. 2017)]
MAGKKNPNLGDKLRQEREGAENTLRDSRSKTADSSTGDGGKKKAEHRRQIRHEADLAKMRSKKLKSDQEAKAKKNAAASGKKGGKPKKPGNLAADALSAKAHQSVRNADQDNNSGVEAAHFTEGSAEGAARAGSRFQYGRKLRQYKKLERLEKKGNKDAVDSIFAERMKSDPQAGSNLFSRWRQKQAIKKEYAAAKAGAAATENTASGTAKAAQGTVSITEKAFQFVQSHSHIIIGIAAVGLLVLVIAGSVSSCSVLINGGGNVVLGTSYTAEDEDLKGVETDYTKLEDKLRKQIDRIETDHPGYDEYRYNLAEIGHNPYELASLLTVEFENYTRSQVQARLQSIFEAQYELKLEEKVEIRTRKETRVGYRYNPITGTGHTYTYQVTVQYEYKILNVTLLNRGVDYVARNSGLTDDQLQRYEVTLECRGNRDDLFAGIAFATPDGAGSSGEYQDYDIPGEALTDEKFRKMITEAEKYLGYPYVWGGSSPSTSFDCSGFVSWVINHCGNGWNVGRQTANGLMGKCDIIPKSEAKPGDLIFFQKTYNTSGASHVGIYVGNGMMIHCGSPISYASIETSYWRQHYYCMGRIR